MMQSVNNNVPLRQVCLLCFAHYELFGGVCFLSDRVYVKVSSDFDQTGYMQPRLITWPDGRVFRIQDVRAFRPAASGRMLDCFTVIVCGKEKHLFFERAGEQHSCRLGRWFVEQA